MKNLLLLTLVLITSLLQAQKTSYQKLDSLQFIKKCDKIILDTGKDFKVVGQDISEWRKYIQYNNSNNEMLYIVYNINNEGANADLEIKGVKKWNIDSVASKYLTVFDLYQKEFDAKADKVSIQKNGMPWGAADTGARLRKTSQEGLWEMKITN